MSNFQQGILEDVPKVGRYITFSLIAGADPTAALKALANQVDGKDIVVGLGRSLVLALGADLAALKDYPSLSAAGIELPSTPAALWCWLRGSDKGDLVNQTHQIVELIGEAFECETLLDSFKYADGRDLTGYEDGTENPEGEEAIQVAFATSGEGLKHSSFVAVQTWIHDLSYFKSIPGDQQDNMIGRRKSDNEELDDAPASAHVKRTAQEDFSPEAFMLRRSMPWADATGEGLQFVAFGESFASFEAQMARMMGLEDGIADALFQFTKPVSGAYFWCPPMKANGSGLDLAALGL